MFAALDAAPVLVADTVRRAWQLADQGVVVPEAYDHGLAKADWEAARAWVKAHRLPPLDAAQLRRMWALHIASSRSLAEALDAGVTRNEVDGLRPHLPRGDSSTTCARMRAF